MNSPNVEETPTEIWQVDVSGQIYESNFDELTQWISEGALLRADKVRRGNLRWLEAGRIPALMEFFNAKDEGIAPPQVTTTVAPKKTETSVVEPVQAHTFTNDSAKQNVEKAKTQHQPINQQPVETKSSTEGNLCIIHPDVEAFYFCETCTNHFCKACPATYSSVKICPMCGAMCKARTEISQKQVAEKIEYASNEKFGFVDLGRAFAYPFKFKISLVFGAIMFMLFTLGQSAAGIGGIFMLVAALFSAMLANTLTFGILANTVENFSQGKIGTNFMPSFEDFSAWDDVLHPFFLSIGVYISSFAPFFLIVVALFFLSGSSTGMFQQGAVSSVAPELQADYADANKTSQIKSITDNLKQINDPHIKQIESVENYSSANSNQNKFDEEKYFQDLNNQVEQGRKAQLESAVAKAPENDGYGAYLQSFQKVGLPFVILAGLAFLWGLIYMPAACAVAGYTRSFTSTVNPLVGIDTMKRLGADYVKVLLMCLVLAIFTAIVSSVLGHLLAPLDIPQLGNLPATAIKSLFGFYASIVFAVILGFALYKNSAKLSLLR